MKRVLYLSNFSSYDTRDFIVRDEDTRTASIFDKMIEIAARKCDRYASDIFYDMLKLYECCEAENQKELKKLIFFEPYAVNSFHIDSITENSLTNSAFTQTRQHAWLLVHRKKKKEGCIEWETIFIRVNARVETIDAEEDGAVVVDNTEY